MNDRFIVRNIDGEDIVIDKKRNINIPLKDVQDWIGWYTNNINIFEE